MRVLVACEFSGAVRDAFIARGHDAWSCDNTEPPEGLHPSQHLACDVQEVLDDNWGLMIAHPPCTYLAVSGARWNTISERRALQAQALDFVRLLLDAPIPKIALENPVGAISKAIRKPDQIIEPWQFGVEDHKQTCLWLKGLPRLRHTKVIFTNKTLIHRMAPGPERAKNRSRTYPPIAEAMADQWGAL